MKFSRSHLTFTRSQRDGILYLAGIVFAGIALHYFVEFPSERILDTNSPEIMQVQRILDSLKARRLDSNKKQHPFNPNYISEFKAYTLGMSIEEFERLQQFRNNGNWINSTRDFKRVTMISDSLLEQISPLFKFPDWVQNKSRSLQKKESGHNPLPEHMKLDLNLATREQLMEINGIGPALSERILNYRTRLGGFVSGIELHQVYGLREEVVERILNVFKVKTPRNIVRYDINIASASDIATIPGIDFELAKKIWEFRVLNERISSFSELNKIAGLSPQKLRLIELYLFID